MTILRRIAIALLAVLALASGAARATYTTNYSDQWWIEAESGWGACVLQQWDVMFVDLFVYGIDNNPTYFTVAAFHQTTSPANHAVFVGDLYRTTGPYFGGPFAKSAVTYEKVGTLTFDADTVTGNTATLTYTVGSVTVVKNVTRVTWRNENIGGAYYGGMVYEQTSCSDTVDNGHYEVFGTLNFSHYSNNAVTIGLQISSVTMNGMPITIPAGASFTINGTYTQAGHLGIVTGRSAIVIPGEGTDNASVSLFEIERSASGISGRYTATDDVGGCKTSGRFAGVRR